MTYALGFLIPFLAGWSVAASEVLFKTEQRPGMLRGTPGMILLLALTGVAGLSAAGGILWVFQSIHSSMVLVFIGAGAYMGWRASNWLNVAVEGTVNRLLVGVSGLLFFYAVVWTFLPPA
jgi:hypothetical protein